MKKNIRKNMRVLKELFYLRLHGLMVFRFDFFAPFLIDGSLFLMQILAFGIVYRNVETIGDWEMGEMVIYIGTFSLLNALSMTFCFFGVSTIPYKVRSGELDLYLTKPVSPLFRLTFENISPGSFLLVFTSIGIILYGVGLADVRLTAGRTASYIFWLLVMAVLYYDMEVLFRCVSLYTVSMARMEQVEDACLDLCMKLPGMAFHGVYKVIFYFFLPYGLMATLPVQSMAGKLSLQAAGYGTGVVLCFSLLTAVVWKRGLTHYNSASS